MKLLAALLIAAAATTPPVEEPNARCQIDHTNCVQAEDGSWVERGYYPPTIKPMNITPAPLFSAPTPAPGDA